MLPASKSYLPANAELRNCVMEDFFWRTEFGKETTVGSFSTSLLAACSLGLNSMPRRYLRGCCLTFVSNLPPLYLSEDLTDSIPRESSKFLLQFLLWDALVYFCSPNTLELISPLMRTPELKRLLESCSAFDSPRRNL